jgi:hypothetical protein
LIFQIVHTNTVAIEIHTADGAISAPAVWLTLKY